MAKLMTKRDRGLAVVVVSALAASGGALVLQAYDVIRMPFTISFVALPGLLLVIAVTIRAHTGGRAAFVRRVTIGLVIGVFALLAYDLSRAVIAFLTPTSFDPFRAHPNYGAAMLSTSPDTIAALVGGWAYHVWNGLTFSVMYTVAVGRGRLGWAVLWAMGLEVATIVVTPAMTGVDRTDLPFITVSLLGHLFYGVTLGILALNWLPGDATLGPWQIWKPSLKVVRT